MRRVWLAWVMLLLGVGAAHAQESEYTPPSSAGPGGGAPTDAQYITAAADGTLSAERVCTDTATIDCDAGTAAQMKFNIVAGSAARITSSASYPTTPCTPGDIHTVTGVQMTFYCGGASSWVFAFDDASDGFSHSFSIYSLFTDSSNYEGIYIADQSSTNFDALLHPFSGGTGSDNKGITLMPFGTGLVGISKATDVTIRATFDIAALTVARNFTWPDAAGDVAVISSLGFPVRTAAQTWAARSFTSGDGSNVIVNPAGTAGDVDLTVDTAVFMRYASGTGTVSGTGSIGTCYAEKDANLFSCYTATNTPRTFFSLSDTLGVANGGTGLTAGTSGGVPTYTASGALTSSAALTANLPVIGGGAGAVVGVGSRSGNTTAYVTTTGAQTSGDCVKIDANGNHIANGSACGGSGPLYIMGGGGQLVRVNTSATEYMVPWGGIAGQSSTESFMRARFPATCTLGNWYVNLVTAQPASGSLVLTVRVDGAGSALTITIAANAATGIYSDATHTVAVTAGQWVVVEGVNNATAESGFMNSWTMTCS